jgi:nitrogen regulatory protein PII
MKAVMITYNLALTEKVEYTLEHFGIRGYTEWDNVEGVGSKTGVPHLGTHTWPEINGVIITFVDDPKVAPLLEAIKRIDQINEDVGIRAFVWNIEQMV